MYSRVTPQLRGSFFGPPFAVGALRVMRGNLRYTPTHVVQQEPMKSAREGNCFRLVSDGVVHRSRTITRTISKQRNRRGKKVSRCQHGWVVLYLNLSHAGLPVAPSEFDLGTRRHILSLLQSNGPLALVLTDNQGKDRNFQRFNFLEKSEKNTFSEVSTSAHIPDVPLQLCDCVVVAGECPHDVRVCEDSQHAKLRRKISRLQRPKLPLRSNRAIKAQARR
jgi:hypothetical protein